MKFELNSYKQELTDEEILLDIKKYRRKIWKGLYFYFIL